MRLLVKLALPLALVAGHVGAQDIKKSADSVMREAEANGFSGAVLLAKDGKVVFENGYGMANRAENIRFTPNTIVQIGSNTKDFTAVSILQLQDRGLLSLDDRVSKFFPSAPPDKANITVRQLMNHTAGYPLGLGGDFDQSTRDQMIDAAMKFKLLFEPGARESYSNTGFSLLAAIIEIVSGKTYDEYVRDNIIKPLGLEHTGFLLPKFASRDLAHGYDRTGADQGTMLSKPHAADGPYWNLRGNGGMLSTVGDMFEFYRVLFNTDKLLKPETRDSRFNPKQPIALAGSDLVNFFLYERFPARNAEMIIASTNQNAKAPQVREGLAAILGLPSMKGGTQRGGAGGDIARAVGKPVDPGAEKVARDLIAAINSGDKGTMTSFIREHFVQGGEGDPTAEERAERWLGMHANLGKIEVLRMSQVDEAVQVILKTENEEQALLSVVMEKAAPWKIIRIGIQVGGS